MTDDEVFRNGDLIIVPTQKPPKPSNHDYGKFVESEDEKFKIRSTLSLRVALDEEDRAAVYNFIREYEARIAILEATLGKTRAFLSTTTEVLDALKGRLDRINRDTKAMPLLTRECAELLSIIRGYREARATLEEISR